MADDDSVDRVEDVPPWESDEGGYTLTLKAGKGYEDAWLILRDKTSEGMKRRIIAAFGMKAGEDGDPMDLSLIALIQNATTEFHALGNINREFPGARAMSSRGRGSRRASGGAADSAPDAPDAPAEPQEPVDPNVALIAEIEGFDTVDALKRFWVNHNPLAPEVEAAWRAKGKALQAAAQ